MKKKLQTTLFAENLTPAMQQYHRIKAHYREAILFFRMGDFYEMFYEDAQEAARLLGLALTSRNSGKAKAVPLAGVPVKAAEEYIRRLIRHGRKVAICEQVEDPKLAKTVVKREVLEVVTPGTVLSESLLEGKKNNFLVALTAQDQFGLAYVDLSTGEFYLAQLSRERVRDELTRIQPSEVLVPQSWAQESSPLPPASPAGVSRVRLAGGSQPWQELASLLGSLPRTYREDWRFSPRGGAEKLMQHFGVLTLEGFGCQDRPLAVSAAGALLGYLEEVQPAAATKVRPPKTLRGEEFLILDETTLRNLELLESLRDRGPEGALLAVLDRTLTPMGGRLLRRWITQPLRSVGTITERLDAVEEVVRAGLLRRSVREQLKQIGDVERLTERVAAGRASPRDLVALKQTLERMPRVKDLLPEANSALLRQLREGLYDLPEVRERIGRALADEPPFSLAEPGVIRPGYHQGLDALRALAHGGKEWIAQLQARERTRTGIPSLKVGFNKVFGYYIEVTKPNLKLVPPDYLRKQTVANGERFFTPELKEREAQILQAEERILALEQELFAQLRDWVTTFIPRLQVLGEGLALLDVLATLAEVAVEYNYCRPEIHEGLGLEIRGGRHPVVERMLAPGAFVPNDCRLDPETEQIMILTGPNMAGKSTYLRQVGLIVLMAQMGSFVPASSARIGLVDRIFTRVGASDNLAGGQSTFLIEMAEAANILHHATPGSLILLDEIGRGTSTFDGLAIAWAVAEYLHQEPTLAAKTIFATHYHELTQLEALYPRTRNYNILVKEWGDEVIFLRQVARGGSDRSYGIQVARIAGLPNPVIERAREILGQLEAGEWRLGARGRQEGPQGQLPFVESAPGGRVPGHSQVS